MSSVMVKLISELKTNDNNNNLKGLFDSALKIQGALTSQKQNNTLKDMKDEAYHLMDNLMNNDYVDVNENINDILFNAKLIGWK